MKIYIQMKSTGYGCPDAKKNNSFFMIILFD